MTKVRVTTVRSGELDCTTEHECADLSAALDYAEKRVREDRAICAIWHSDKLQAVR